MQAQSSTQTATKVCTKCGETKPATLEFFYGQKAHRDGLQPQCKVCRAACNAAHRAAHLDEAHAYEAAWRAAHPGNVRASSAAYCATHREERRARSAAWDANHPEERAAYGAAYRAEHREEERAYTAAWRAAHPGRDRAYRAAHTEERRAYNAAYDAAHREEKRARMTAYNAAHREESRPYQAAWYAAHREQKLARGGAWEASHPEERRAIVNNRRARKLGNGGTHTAADVAAQRQRQAGLCIYCGAKLGRHYHVDHAFPLLHGGTSWPENLVVACQRCNRSKHARDPREFVGDRRPACPGMSLWPWEEHPIERLRVERPQEPAPG